MNSNKNNQRVYAMSVASVYRLYIEKAEKKGRTKAEVDEVIRWLTGHSQESLERELANKTTFETFFTQAKLNPARELITGSVCGVKLAEIEECNRLGIERIGVLADDAFLVAGAALYAGEGAKRDGAVQFANTDARMIAMFCAWLRRFFTIDESRLRIRVYLHEGLDLDRAHEYWSEVTGVPTSQFQSAANHDMPHKDIDQSRRRVVVAGADQGGQVTRRHFGRDSATQQLRHQVFERAGQVTIATRLGYAIPLPHIARRPVQRAAGRCQPDPGGHLPQPPSLYRHHG